MNGRLINYMTAALVLHYGAFALAEDSVAEVRYEAAIEQADVDYKVAMAKCDSLKGNVQDICEAEANKDRDIAKSNAEAMQEGTAEARAEASKDAADAELALAKQKCDQLRGNEHDVCVKAAQLEHTNAVTGADTNEAVAEAIDERRGEMHDAQYELAMEKCEALRGDAQDLCELEAKAGTLR